jgi:hypothetical protein
VLFVYVTTHLLGHSLGLISLDAMEDRRGVFPPLGTTSAAALRFADRAFRPLVAYRRRGSTVPPAESSIALGHPSSAARRT